MVRVRGSLFVACSLDSLCTVIMSGSAGRCKTHPVLGDAPIRGSRSQWVPTAPGTSAWGPAVVGATSYTRQRRTATPLPPTWSFGAPTTLPSSRERVGIGVRKTDVRPVSELWGGWRRPETESDYRANPGAIESLIRRAVTGTRRAGWSTRGPGLVAVVGAGLIVGTHLSGVARASTPARRAGFRPGSTSPRHYRPAISARTPTSPDRC